MSIDGCRADSRAPLRAAVALGLALGLAACSSGGSSGPTASGSSAVTSRLASVTASATVPAAVAHNDVDVMFANDMIPHHGQAVQMADMILARSGNADVKALAQQIKAAQAPEIATMSRWLEDWGVAVPDPYAHAAGMAGMEHSGMMSTEQMKRLESATGVAADKAFLGLMVEHHRGAIDMAATEAAQGADPAAKDLARSITTSQTAEIAQMTKMLTALG